MYLLCYRRKSVVKTASDMVSPRRQKSAVDALATASGYDTEWYEDIDGHNSGRTDDREGWQRLLRNLDRPDIAGVAAYSLDRLSRNVRDILDFADRIKARGLRLILVRENIDTETPMGMAVLTIMAALAQLESDLAAERMASIIDYKRRELKQHWGTVPFGCLRTKAMKLISDPETLPSLHALYTHYATGEYSYSELARKLNENGWRFSSARSSEPREWRRHDVRRVLAMHRLYQGDLPVGRAKDGYDEFIPDAHAPILDPNLCQAVALQLQVRQQRRIQSKGKHGFLLTGLLYCGVCGQKMGGNTYRDRRYYRHRQAKGDCPERQVLAKTIEDQLRTLLSELDLELLDERVREYRLELLQEQPQVAQICGAIDLAEKRLERLPVLYLDGAVTHAQYLQQQQNTEVQIAGLKAQLPELTNANTFHATADRLLLVLDRLADGQPYLAHQILERIDIAAGHITHLEPQEWLAPLWPVVEKLLIY